MEETKNVPITVVVVVLNVIIDKYFKLNNILMNIIQIVIFHFNRCSFNQLTCRFNVMISYNTKMTNKYILNKNHNTVILQIVEVHLISIPYLQKDQIKKN